MTEGSISGKLIGFAVPVFIGQFFQQMYNTVDSLIVGNLINALSRGKERVICLRR